jgi:hypothetical protein
MQAEILAICEAATVNSGKLNILGTFDILAFSKFPVTYDSFSIATTVRFGPDEAGPHVMRVNWIDSDGEVAFCSTEASFEIQFLAGQDIKHFIWHVREKEFFGPSEFLLQLVVDDTPVSSVPLTVKER